MTEILESVKLEMLKLEKALLSKEVRSNVEALNLLIAESFIEFGKSGKVWNKGSILASLPLEGEINGEIQREILNFAVIFQTPNIVCVEYKLSESKLNAGEISFRRSIWKFIDERWQIIFHQGTAL